jgi:hypothetical protein
MYHAGYLEADEQRRADNQDSDRAQRPPDKRKSIPASIGWAMVKAIGMMGCHGDLLRLPNGAGAVETSAKCQCQSIGPRT